MPPSRGLKNLLEATSQVVKTPLSRRELSTLIHRGTFTTPVEAGPCRKRQLPATFTAGQGLPTERPPAGCRARIQRRYASSSNSSNLKHTPLYKVHTDLGARMGPYASYSMPLEYPDQSHSDSHKWTRTHASLFDVSHMVQHKLTGELAEEFLMTVTPSSLDSLKKHSSTLSCLLSPEGGIVDDTVITRIGTDPHSFYFVTNAGCHDQDIEFLDSSMSNFLKSKPDSKSASGTRDKLNWHILEHHALLALQGPLSASVLQSLIFNDTEDETLDTSLSTLYFGKSRWLQLTLPETGMNTPSLLISRTGYTGEDGFEISIPPENGDATELATAIAKALTADSSKVRWAGLAARDSLRLEAGMCLYGHDIDSSITPPVAALGWLVGKDRRSENPVPPFNGHEVINRQLASPKTMESRRVGLLIEKGPAAREGAEIVADNEVIGHVTSGCPSPSLGGQNIAMGYVKNGFHKKGTKLGVKVRKSVRQAEVTKMPFVENNFYRPESDSESKTGETKQ